MECKHQYFKYQNGELVCSVCGKPASEVKKKVEDKIAEGAEVKRIVPKGVERVSSPKRR